MTIFDLKSARAPTRSIPATKRVGTAASFAEASEARVAAKNHAGSVVNHALRGKPRRSSRGPSRPRSESGPQGTGPRGRRGQRPRRKASASRPRSVSGSEFHPPPQKIFLVSNQARRPGRGRPGSKSSGKPMPASTSPTMENGLDPSGVGYNKSGNAPAPPHPPRPPEGK